MDGALLVSILKPGGCKTLGDCTAKVFVPHIEKEQNQAQRVDIVWDQYFDNILNSGVARALGWAIRSPGWPKWGRK